MLAIVTYLLRFYHLILHIFPELRQKIHLQRELVPDKVDNRAIQGTGDKVLYSILPNFENLEAGNVSSQVRTKLLVTLDFQLEIFLLF